MSLPKRLVEQDPRALAAVLVQAARRDAPQPGTRARIFGAVGLSAAVATVAGSVAAGAKAAAAASTATGAAAASVAVPAKWVIIGIAGAVIAGTAAVGGSLLLREPGPSTGLAVPSEPSAEPARVMSTTSPAPAEGEPAKPEAPNAPTAPATSSVRAEAPPSSAPAADSAAAPREALVEPPAAALLAREVALLDQARAELRAGHPRSVVAALDRYHAEFPAGRLAAEATVLRIDALSRSGDREQASQMASEFLAAHPQSPLSTRVRNYVMDEEAKP
jgi:hypothetical protein